jgi:hypothetical protein
MGQYCTHIVSQAAVQKDIKKIALKIPPTRTL